MAPNPRHIARVAIVGNPNCGKTTIFNQLTGLRQKVGNYPGVTVEKKEGNIVYSDGESISLLDLPGTYSLTPNSPDEEIVRDVLFGDLLDTPRPDGVICIVDASNLERSLSLVSQIIDTRLPCVVALNMMDDAKREGMGIEVEKLSELLDVPMVPTVGSRHVGLHELKKAIRGDMRISNAARRWSLPDCVQTEHREIVQLLRSHDAMEDAKAFFEATNLLSTPQSLENFESRTSTQVRERVKASRDRLQHLGYDRHSLFAWSRQNWIRAICASCVREGRKEKNLTGAIDSIVTHRFWGYVIFFGFMAFMFQSIFSWATIPMDLIGEAFTALGKGVVAIMAPGDLRDLLVDGAIGGVGAVVMFLPQIALLFLFLGILEDTGYMARAAFIMDRLMNKVGLHGKSFIPFVSSFACAIPGIMATRTIEDPRDRLVTMLISPLAGCSARLPVYSLLIAAFIPSISILGFWNLQGVVMVSLYLLGIVFALLMAWVFKKTILKGEAPDFVMELPPYRIPSLKSVFIHLWERCWLFLRRAGTIILAVSIVMWFLATYPKTNFPTQSEKLAHSFVGQAGQIIEPVLRPLGFDWKIGIGMLTSLLQREVFVSTISTIYNVQAGEGDPSNLRSQMQKDLDPATGLPKFTVLTAICVMVYYVLAMQCMSTLAVMRRETNGWKWPIFQLGYMTTLAYVVTFVVYRVGLHFV